MLISALAIIVFSRCSSSSKDDGGVPTLNVTSASTSIAYNSTSWSVSITATSAWSLSFTYDVDPGNEWALATRISGGAGTTNIVISAEGENTTGEDRAIILTVALDDTETSQTITLIQKAQGSSSGGDDNPDIPTTEPDYSTRLELPKIKDLSAYLEYDPGDFAMEYDLNRLQPKWVAWPMEQGVHNGSVGRNEKWQNDSRIPTANQPLKSDFSDLGSASGQADRGHICPSGDRQKTKAMNQQTFYYTNMTPQVGAGFNQGIWANLEDLERTWSFTQGAKLYICSGPALYNEDCAYSESELVLAKSSRGMVKSKYNYKVILREKINGGYDAIGFWFENKVYSGNVSANKGVITSVRDIEEKTGIDFFHGLPQETQDLVENTYSLTSWGF